MAWRVFPFDKVGGSISWLVSTTSTYSQPYVLKFSTNLALKIIISKKNSTGILNMIDSLGKIVVVAENISYCINMRSTIFLR